MKSVAMKCAYSNISKFNENAKDVIDFSIFHSIGTNTFSLPENAIENVIRIIRAEVKNMLTYNSQ